MANWNYYFMREKKNNKKKTNKNNANANCHDCLEFWNKQLWLKLIIWAIAGIEFHHTGNFHQNMRNLICENNNNQIREKKTKEQRDPKT